MEWRYHTDSLPFHFSKMLSQVLTQELWIVFIIVKDPPPIVKAQHEGGQWPPRLCLFRMEMPVHFLPLLGQHRRTKYSPVIGNNVLDGREDL